MKRTFRQRMLSILLSACIALGVFVPLQGTQKAAAADDDMYKYEYKNDEGKTVTVWISKEGVASYKSSPFGWDTRGGYVIAKIDVTGSGNFQPFWLSQGGPCGDGIARDSWDEYVAAGAKLSARVGQQENKAYGNYEQSMFWFSANDFKMDSDDSVAGTLISEYLQGYMSKYFNSLYTANFKPGIECEVVWGNAVQVPKGTILDDLEKYEVIPGKPESTTVRPKFIDYALSLNKAGTDMLRASEWTVHEDGTGLTRNGGCDDIGSRVSSTYSGHVKTVPKEELICYSAADMDNATKRICGADGKEAASSGWGYQGRGLGPDTPWGVPLFT